MDYETPDGSQFSLREVWRNEDSGSQGSPFFAYTTISAIVNGEPFSGRLDSRVDDVDDGDLLSALEPVPFQAIYPKFDSRMLEAPAFDSATHYLKTPSFTWDDCHPNSTFVADCFLNEAETLEHLRKYGHPSIVAYHGCVVKDGRITHVCLGRCDNNLVNYLQTSPNDAEVASLIRDVESGIDFLHSLGLAHNDIIPDNTCVANGRAVIVDFDSCLPFGQKLLKGASVTRDEDGYPVSSAENDLRGLEDLKALLNNLLPHSKPA